MRKFKFERTYNGIKRRDKWFIRRGKDFKKRDHGYQKEEAS